MVAFPAFIFQLDVLDSDGIRIGIEVGKYLIFRNPAAVNFVGENELSSLIVELQNDVFPEIFQRNFCAWAGTKLPDVIGPVLEFGIMRNAALKRDRFIFGAARRFAAAAGITSFAMLTDFGRAAQSAYFTYPGNVTAIPLNAEFKVFVRVKTLWVDGKFSHDPEIFFGNEMQAPDRPDTKMQPSCQLFISSTSDAPTL